MIDMLNGGDRSGKWRKAGPGLVPPRTAQVQRFAVPAYLDQGAVTLEPMAILSTRSRSGHLEEAS